MAHLLPGASTTIIAENIRSLKQQGYAEQDAVSRANAHARRAETPARTSPTSDRQFVVVTQDFSGLGWAKKLQEEGETVTVAHRFDDDPKHQSAFNKVGQGWVDTMPLTDAMTKLSTPHTYWIFAENHFPKDADALRAKGQKVFGTSALSERLEHDRKYAVDLAKDAGLPSPPTHAFSTRKEGLALLEAHPNTAYVFKPDDAKFNFLTFVPARTADEDANRELSTYLQHMKKDPGPYILQERIAREESTEVNVEVWVYEGEPIAAFMGLELKRRNTYDLGEMVGCAGDFVQVIPVESPLVQQTIGKMLPFYKKQKYTGFADVNILYTKAGPRFLEVCDRFGYNAHVTLFLTLATDSFANIIASFIDGHTYGMEEKFRTGVGASLTLFVDHPREGLPVHVDDRWRTQFYPFDGYVEDRDATLLLTGYSDEIGVFAEYGGSMEAAAKKLWNELVFGEAVSVPDLYYRTDLGETNYYNAPLLRYQALKKRGLLT